MKTQEEKIFLEEFNQIRAMLHIVCQKCNKNNFSLSSYAIALGVNFIYANEELGMDNDSVISVCKKLIEENEKKVTYEKAEI